MPKVLGRGDRVPRGIRVYAGEEWGRRWSTWAQMDEKARWRRVEKGPDDKEIVIDLVEEWFDEWWRNTGGRVRQGEG